jgi:Na+/phosphate symporter
MVAYLSLIVCVIGLVLYFVATNPKASEAGRIAFAFGLLAFLLAWPRLVQVLPR